MLLHHKKQRKFTLVNVAASAANCTWWLFRTFGRFTLS